MVRHLHWKTSSVTFDDWFQSGSGPRSVNVTGPGDVGSTVMRAVGTVGLVAAIAQLNVSAEAVYSVVMSVSDVPFPLPTIFPEREDQVLFFTSRRVVPAAATILNTSPVMHGLFINDSEHYDVGGRRVIKTGEEVWVRMDPLSPGNSPSDLSSWGIYRLYFRMRLLLLLPEGAPDPGAV